MIRNLIKYQFYGDRKTTSFAKKLLKDNHLVIADIGSTGGLDSKWYPILNGLKVYAFDPDERSFNKTLENLVVINSALWSGHKKLEIYLTKFPSASSVFKPNTYLLDKFLNYECHEIIGSAEVNAITLDEALMGLNTLDFIKIDTEGADLEILFGAKNFLKSTVLGMQIEVQFIERNIGSPLFSDIDPVVRASGYWLLELKKQSWIRRSNIFNVQSVPQLIWADAIYMISDVEALKRASILTDNERKSFLKKIVVLSANFNYYDYAHEMIEIFRINNMVEQAFLDALINDLKFSMSTNFRIISKCIINFCIVYCGVLLFKIFREKNELIEHLQLEVTDRLLRSISMLFSRQGPNKVAINN